MTFVLWILAICMGAVALRYFVGGHPFLGLFWTLACLLAAGVASHMP